MSAAGLKDQRITIQRRAAGQDGFGNANGAWTDVCTTWAQAVVPTGRQSFAAGVDQYEVDVRFVIGYREGIDGTHRVLWRSKPHDVITALPRGRKVELELVCVSGVRDGR